MRVGNHTVRWHHTKVLNEVHDTETDKTVCQIIKHEHNQDILVSEGSATRYYKDTPCRQKGCKAALAAALLTLDKDDRVPFWEMYRTSTAHARWKGNNVAVEAN